MPCENNLLGDFDAKIIRIYIHSKFFANLWVSNCDPKNNTKLTIPYATSLKNSTFNHAKSAKKQSIRQNISKNGGNFNHFIPYIHIIIQKSAAKF